MTRGKQIAAAIAVGIGALLYGVSPIDVIPELLTGPLGFTDDVLVWVGAGFAIWKILRGEQLPPRGTQPPPPA